MFGYFEKYTSVDFGLILIERSIRVLYLHFSKSETRVKYLQLCNVSYLKQRATFSVVLLTTS